MSIKQKFLFYIATVIVFMFGVYTGHVIGDRRSDSTTNYVSSFYSLLYTGNENIDVEMSITISYEGILTYTLYNNSAYTIGFIPERVLLYKKTPEGFVRLSPVNQINLGMVNGTWPGSSLTLSVDIGYIFFPDGQIIPGVYKFVRVICRVNDPMGGSHLSIIYIANTFAYAVFEIKQ